jgi:hypothetical protein
MDSTTQNFQFVGCGVEFDLAIDEGISTSHHLIQSKNYEIDCAGSFNFHNKKDDGKNAQAIENRHQQITGHDALLSSLLNPLEGPRVLSCGNMELEGAPDF